MSRLIEISGCENTNRKADVIFVHGLGGDAHGTWRHGKDESTSWPHWLGDDFSEIGVWSLDYASSPTWWSRFIRLFGRGSRDTGYSMSLPDRSLQVLDRLCQKGLGQRPLFFICHSLGGLLVKMLLRRALDSLSPEMQDVARQTRAVLFLATPHSGVKLASLGCFFKMFLVFRFTVSIEELRAHDAHLRDLFDWYRNKSQHIGIFTTTYFEQRPVMGFCHVVSATSAHPGVGANPVGLDEDHLSIAKPRERNSQVCDAVRDILQKNVLATRRTVLEHSTNKYFKQLTDIFCEEQGQSINNMTSVMGEINDKNSYNCGLKCYLQDLNRENIGYIYTEGLKFGLDIDLSKISLQYLNNIQNAIHSNLQKEEVFKNVSKILEEIETADEIGSEIEIQLNLWNYDNALYLSERLEKHISDIKSSTSKKIIRYLFLIARTYIISAERHNKNKNIYIEKACKILDLLESNLAVSTLTDFSEDVIALRGSVENIRNGPKAALQFLADREGPYAIRIRLALHLSMHEVDRAIELIDDKPPHLRWCEFGVTAYATANRRDDAKALIDWVSKQKDRSKYLQCIVLFADASLMRAVSAQTPGRNILPRDLCESEKAAVQQVLKDLNPVLSPIITSGSVDSELATMAVKIGCQAHHLLGHHDEVATLSRLMLTRTPIPTDVARTVMSGYMSPPPDLPKRLREDHPDDLNASILAALVELQAGDLTIAFEETKKLIPLAITNDQKEELFRLFQQIWHELDGDAATECQFIARPLIVHNPKLQVMFDAARALRAGDGALALDILDKAKTEDDIYWLQLKSSALMQQGHVAKAVETLKLAAHNTGDPMLLSQTADLAFNAKMMNIAVDCYEKLVLAHPKNIVARGNLFSLYAFHLNDIEKAVAHGYALHEAEPENKIFTLNLAFCLSKLFLPKESLDLYNEACKDERPELRAILGRAELYLSIGDPDAACTSLKQFQDIHWDSPDFLLAVLNIAYAAGDEEFANEALIKLNELRSAELVDTSEFRLVHSDELIEFFKNSFKATEDRKKRTHSEMLIGRMPWILEAQLSSDAIYWAWRQRTQDLNWIMDDPIIRASYTIYSTNGFHSQSMKDGRRSLLPLKCPPPGTPVVADLSALITLHRLDLLDKAADYFGEIQIPQAYLGTVLQDGKKMVIHQRSRQRTAEEITHLVSTKTIIVINRNNYKKIQLPVVDEYDDTDVHRYHLVDVIKPVYDAGLIGDTAFERISKVCRQPSGVDDEHRPLTRLQDVHIELSTLETLALFGHLSTISKFFCIHVTEDAKNELKQRLASLHFNQETKDWHFDLWRYIRTDGRFRFVRSETPQEMKDKKANNNDLLAFSAYFIAHENGTPLLADDRVCQTMMLNMHQDSPYAAFGTNTLILALSESCDKLNASSAADAMLTLMRWRYRFIIPSVSILKTYAAQYRRNPPGLPLRNVAEYVHDCMRDAGLFCGIENTELNESMAIRLYSSWLNILAEWLVDLWSDCTFTNDTASQLTDWCVQECLPSLPSAIHQSAKVRIGSLTSKIFITHILLNLIYITDEDRARECMKSIQKSLNISDEKYLKIVTEILNVTRRTEAKS